jgi:uncharacterized protein YcnI
MTPRATRLLASALVTVALALAALIGFAPAAAAHVAVDSATPNGDGTTTVTLVWNHSCTPGTATTGVQLTAGDGVEFTGASTGLAGWTSTAGPAQVTFTGPAVPTGQQAAVSVTARITAAPGATVTFPSVQQCGEQQTGWTDPDASSDHPAPSLIATAAIIAPATLTAAPKAGADLSEVLLGVLLLVAVLAGLGVAAERASGGMRSP